MSEKELAAIAARLGQLNRLIESLRPAATPAPDFVAADAFVWHAETRSLQPVPKVSRVDIDLLKGIDRMRDILLENTERFARGLPPTTSFSGARGDGQELAGQGGACRRE